jgi:Zn finger protein HypA/HybF involved in hydrogenase expression
MFKCKECFGTFEELNCGRCPLCGGEEIAAAYKCNNCDEYVPLWDLTDGLCDKCVKTVEIFAREALRQNLTEAELAYISRAWRIAV